MLQGHTKGKPILVARRGDGYFAIGAMCTHYGAPLAIGIIVDDTVRCPWHHACFSLRTGEASARRSARRRAFSLGHCLQFNPETPHGAGKSAAKSVIVPPVAIEETIQRKRERLTAETYEYFWNVCPELTVEMPG